MWMALIILFGEMKRICWEIVLHIVACCFQLHVLQKCQWRNSKPVSSHNAHSRQIITDSDYTYEAISSNNIKSFSDSSFWETIIVNCKHIIFLGKPKGTYDISKWTVSWVLRLSLVVGLWFWLHSLSFCRTTWIVNGAHRVLERQWQNNATSKRYLQDTCWHYEHLNCNLHLPILHLQLNVLNLLLNAMRYSE